MTGVVLPLFQVPWEEMWAPRQMGLLQALGHQGVGAWGSPPMHPPVSD